MASIDLIAIQSVVFPSAFLRVDGNGVINTVGAGSGTVNCQFYASGTLPVPTIGNLEVFEVIPIASVANGFGIRSLNYSSAFLRIDGSQVTQYNGTGSGTVNCQYYGSGSYPTVTADYELLILSPVSLGSTTAYSIRPAPFTHAFLRMDGSSVTQPQGAGSGVVNCQFYPSGQAPNNASDWELFRIIPLPSFTGTF